MSGCALVGLMDSVSVEGPAIGCWGGVEGPAWGNCALIAGLSGKSRAGHVATRYAVLLPEFAGVGKKMVSSGLRRQVSRIAGARMVRILLLLRYASLPLSFAIRTSSTGHFAGVRAMDTSSDCL